VDKMLKSGGPLTLDKTFFLTKCVSFGRIHCFRCRQHGLVTKETLIYVSNNFVGHTMSQILSQNTTKLPETGMLFIVKIPNKVLSIQNVPVFRLKPVKITTSLFPGRFSPNLTSTLPFPN